MKRYLHPLIALSILSLIPVLHFNNLLDIHRVIIRDGIFSITNKDTKLSFGKLRSDTYNLFLRFYPDEAMTAIDHSNLAREKVPYSIDVELMDSKNNIVKREVINQNSRIQSSGGNGYFEWRLMFFLAERGEQYRLRITYNSDFEPFDNMRKTIYVETPYDYASLPFWHLFRMGFFIIFLITFIPSVIIAIVLYKRTGRWNG